jgi:hypothetical protein
MTAARRRTAFVALLALCVVGAGVAILAGLGSGGAAKGGSTGALADAQQTRRPVVLYRTGDRAQGPGGQLALASLAQPGTPATALHLSCGRVSYAGGAGLCLTQAKGFAAGYEADVFGADLKVRHRLAVEGVPSRARVSPDGRYGAVTLFVTGHSYAAAGQFSTDTTLIDMRSGREVAQLERFAVTKGDRQLTALDMNFWGVTFARDSDRFYATVATGGKTYLVEGSVRGRTARVLHENVECPSLSPDGTRIAYKKRTGPASRPWHLTVLDLATMHETPLAETRSIDDQVEWLDDRRVLYGVGGDVDVAAADGTGRPARFLTGGGSPTVLSWAARTAAS